MKVKDYFPIACLRKNADVCILKPFPIRLKSDVLLDEMVFTSSSQCRLKNLFRRLKLLDTKENELTILTNRFDLDAYAIAEIYNSRWAIELFLNE